jgi:PAS domain S-box-containing protein
MPRKPTYEELENRVAALEGENRRLAEVQGELGKSRIWDTHSEQQTLFSMSLDLICIADIHTVSFLKINPAFTTTLGYSEAELLSVPFTDFIHPEDLEPTRQAVTENLRKGKKVINFKNRYRCKNGKYRWLNWVSHPAPEKGVTYAVAHDITDEIDAYETLRSQRDLLNSLFDNLPMGVTIWSDDGRLLMINQGFTALTGYTRAEIADIEAWFDIVYPDPEYRRLVRENWQMAVDESAGGAREFRITCRNGKVKDVEFHESFLKDGRALVTMADITDRRQAQEDIRKRRQFLESVLYHAPDAIITLDERHRVLDWNPGAVKMFGYTPEEAIGSPLDGLVARYDHFREANAKTARVLSGRRVEAFETIRYRKDGAPIHVIAAGSPIMIEGVLKGVVAVYTDITDRVRSEEALRISHQRFITVLNSMDALIYVADIKTHEILFTNRHMIEVHGRDLTGKICWKVFRKGSGPCPECTNDRLVDPDGRPTGLIVWQGHNPIYGKWYINYDRAIEWIDGRMVRLQIALDITDYKKMEDALRRAQKMEAVGTLAGGIAHDFNNLLMGIQGRTSLIAVDLDPAHPHAEHTAAIQEYIQSAANLTKQLLGFVRGGKYEVKPFDIHALVESSAVMFGRTRKEIRIRIRPSSEPLVVEADKRQIEQVLLNIYINAWQAMPEGGDLTSTRKWSIWSKRSAKSTIFRRAVM